MHVIIQLPLVNIFAINPQVKATQLKKMIKARKALKNRCGRRGKNNNDELK